jgi:hypothetical protein
MAAAKGAGELAWSSRAAAVLGFRDSRAVGGVAGSLLVIVFVEPVLID